jgi:CHASE2 domain-containing sensor protein
MTEFQAQIPSQVLDRAEEELSALPIWTVTLGVFALLTFGLTAIPSIICGHLALGKKRGSFERSVATAGLVVGYIGAAVLGVWLAFLMGRVLL